LIMVRKVFISGPIQGVETQQSYRIAIKQICVRCGFEAVDPWERERVLYGREQSEWWNKVPAASFIQRDLEDIEKCDLLVAYLPKLSAGTCMELFYARIKGKQTVCICLIKSPSPWITFHSDTIIKSIEELEPVLRQRLWRTGSAGT
jgi:nucleoside 2-deoxyribosyltransferase